MDNALGKILFSELITYYKDVTKDSENIASHTNKLEDIFNKKEVSNIVSNMINIFFKDFKDIISRIKSIFIKQTNGVSNSGNSFNAKLTNEKVNTFLFLFTESKELFIIDALTGFTHIRR